MKPMPVTQMQMSPRSTLKAVIAWIVIFHSALLTSAYWFRGTTITGIDVVILAGVVMNVFFGGILFLVLYDRKRRLQSR